MKAIICTIDNQPLDAIDIKALEEFAEYRKLRANKIKCFMCKKQAVINVVMTGNIKLPSCKKHITEINELNNPIL